MKKIVIFDMDGVLIDSEVAAREYMISVYPMITKKMHQEILCGNFHEEMEKFRLAHPPKPETDDEREARKAAFAEKKAQCGLFDGIYDTLQQLHSDGYILVLNTSAIECNTTPLLERTGISSLFDFVATGEVSKSKVEKFAIIADRYKEEPGNMLFVTDTLGDIREADTAGVSTVAVTWGLHDTSFFNREPHENLKGIVTSISQLQNFISQYFA